MFIKQICELFKAKEIPFAIVGGYAVALHGIARGTFDVDIITEISSENFEKIEKALIDIGLQPLHPFAASDLYSNLEKYVTEKNLIAWNFRNPTRLRDSIDIIITQDLRKMQVIHIESDFGSIPVLSIASLIKMKSQTNREQDQNDIAALKLLSEKSP